MDTSHNINLLQEVASKEALVNLLNEVLKTKVGSARKAKKQPLKPFTLEMLNYYSNPRNESSRYKQFTIKKKSGGERLISAPKTEDFGLLLRCLNDLFKQVYTPSQHAMGFTEGRSVVTNADVHRGANYIFNLDLRDFFPSINRARVCRRLQERPIGMAPTVAKVVASLCCMRLTTEGKRAQHVLPQGAPTSPIITNMVCDRLDRKLARLAKDFGIHYTRYADDITFSSMHNVYREEGTFRRALQQIITEEGFAINESKTRLQKVGARQEVTGIIVSQKLNVTRDYVHNVRNILYIWRQYGYESAKERFAIKYKREKGHGKKEDAAMVYVIYGKLMYMRMVKGASDPIYQRLFNDFARLLDQLEEL